MSTINVPTKWLTLKEAAEYARCSTVTLAREIRAGRLKAYKLSARRVWRIQIADCDSWISGDSGDEPIPYIVPRHSGDRS